jgi:hypothetical protein
VGPEHAWLKDSGRARYTSVTDAEALAAFHTLTRIEGIIPALESSHAIAYAAKLAPPWAATSHPDQPLRARRQGHAHRGRARGAATVSRIAQRFEALRADGRKALIPFVTAGDPAGADRPADAPPWSPPGPI